MSSEAGTANSTAEIFQAIVPGKSYELTAGADQQIGPFTKGVSAIRICTGTGSIFISFGSNPDTTDPTNRTFIPASYIEYFSIPEGMKMALSGTGSIYINEAAISGV